jgi:predicted O-methyltransferase YrrM
LQIPKNILEIGTYIGTSLIEMLKLYPDASGTAIDTWKNYVENIIETMPVIEENGIKHVFLENVKKAGMSHRVRTLKGDSVKRLLELIERKEDFDFIYVDGSHKCLDCYADMILAWKLLIVGGVLAVDDVLYHYSKVLEGELLSYPLMGKLHFMEKYKGEYEIISDGYRTFIKKI